MISTIRTVQNALPHPDDFHLAQECLEQKHSALAYFQNNYREPLMAFLLHSGASFDEASEVINDLWADCLATQPDSRPRLHRYNGMCALQTWLNTVALNNLVTRKRRTQRWQKLIPDRLPAAEDDEDAAPNGGSTQISEPEQAPLLEIMRHAVDYAFQTCNAEDFVLLQLAYCDELKVRELATMFRCDGGTISRRLDKAQRGINAATMAHIKQRDPWLDLKWDDFVELCRSANPAYFRRDED
jgi:RNA polymerase sigma factor (sigma-70 family)